MMTALLSRASKELDRAEQDLRDTGVLEMMGYMMSLCFATDEAAWAEGAAAALTEWARTKRQFQEAKRIATWNPERGWKRA